MNGVEFCVFLSRPYCKQQLRKIMVGYFGAYLVSALLTLRNKSSVIFQEGDLKTHSEIKNLIVNFVRFAFELVRDIRLIVIMN